MSLKPTHFSIESSDIHVHISVGNMMASRLDTMYQELQWKINQKIILTTIKRKI